MVFADELKKMEAQLKASDVPIWKMCYEAGINPSTWSRWKSDQTVPNMATWGRVQAAHQRLTGSIAAA